MIARAVASVVLANLGSAALRGFAALIVAGFLVGACASAEKSTPGPRPTATAPSAASYQRTAESQYLSRMKPELADLVRAQPWFLAMDQPKLDLVDAMARCLVEAQRRGEADSVGAMLRFAAEQSWYQDGLDERETVSLAAVFDAYAFSLKDDNAPPIGPVLASALSHALFDVADLPETGRFVVLVSADDPRQGRQALRLTLEALPRVEAVVGKYPYKFLHVQMTDDLPEYIRGVSYNQFIALANEHLGQDLVAHELTHSTLYGIFPLWFEEGIAEFMERYLPGTLEAGVREFREVLDVFGVEQRLDIRPSPYYNEVDAYLERAQGFLFLHGVFEILGDEGLKQAIRSLRTRTFGDQDLLRALASTGSAETQARLAQHICRSVTGTTRDYCAPR